MNLEQLHSLLKSPEDAYLERKPEGVKRAEIRKTIVAFANSVPVGREAVLFIGVRDAGEIQGVKNPDDIQKLVRLICAMDCYPAIQFQSEILTVQGKHVMAVIVPRSDKRPHFSGPAFVRKGSESVVASEGQYEELIASRNDKCFVLQSWKSIVSIQEIDFKLDSGRKIANWNAHRAGYVIDCNPHTIRLRDESGTTFTVQTSQVEISYDEIKYRNKILIRG